MLDGYQLLANAIVERAAIDYQNMLCGITIQGETAERTRRFFFSGYFQLLTDLDGWSLVKSLEFDCKSVGYDYQKLQNLRSLRRSSEC